MRPPQIADSGLMSQMGIINAFRTGNPVLDVFLCMVIPVIMQFLFKSTSNLSPAIMKYLERFSNPKPDYVRIITFERTMSDNGCELDNGGVPSRNSILQKAILMYLDTLDIDYTTSRVQLMAIKEQQLYDRRRMRLPYGTTSEQLKCYNVTISPPVGTWVMLLPGLEFKMTRDTASDEASTSNKKQVNNQGNGGEGKVKQFTTTFEFRANTGSRPKSKHLVEQFIRDAFQWYVDRMTELTNPTRYLYMLAAESKAANPSPSPPRNPTSTSQGTKYNRYPLCGEKTFDTLFFPRKDNLLKLLNDFVNKTGKYQIKGYPHRLGLLLHGPPGSGKTSLAKAIAERTGRNVVSIPLGRIKTNAQLYNIVFDKVYKVPDEDMPVKLGFEDIIFVMEDIDCASDVVHRREGSQIVQRSKQQTILHNRSRASLKRTCGVLQAILKDGQEGIDFEKALSEGASMMCDETSTLPTSDSETSLDLVESSSNIQEQIETQEEAECEPPETAPSPKQVDVLSSSEECEGHDDEANQERMPKVKTSSNAKHEEALMARGLANLLSSAGKGDSKDGDSPFMTLREREESDKLDLSGILNVLDGIVETPNRILIMTSNHPELLDPALIRPGRIDKRIMLDYAKPAEIIEMINHYFGPMLEQREIVDGETGQLTHLECQVIETLFQHNAVKWTAAQIEQLCAEHDYVEDFLMDLVQQVGEHPVLDDFI